MLVESFGVEKYIPPAQRPANLSTMVKALKAVGPITQPLYVYSFSYDTLFLIALAAKQANSIAPAKVSAALDHLKQPAHKPYTSFPVESYTPSEHALTASPSDFLFLPEGPLVDGMLGAPAGTKS
jgi:ABC-type branched-subunit amino acid transport system substrate-binding protein